MSLTLQPKVLIRLQHCIIIQPYDRDVGKKGARVRLEFRSADPKDDAFALAVTSPCVACGTTVHPFRRRKAKGGKLGSIYIAATCPWEDNNSCSRSKKAADEYLAIRAAVKRLKPTGKL